MRGTFYNNGILTRFYEDGKGNAECWARASGLTHDGFYRLRPVGLTEEHCFMAGYKKLGTFNNVKLK